MRRLTFDRDRCLACRSCELACAVAHSTSGALLPAIDERPAPRRRVSIAQGPRGIAALRCSQCDEPLCVFSCKSGALYRRLAQTGTGPQIHGDSRRSEASGLADGGVEFDESRCVGCLMCYMVCAWGIRRSPAFAAVNRDAATAWRPSPDNPEAKAGQVWDPASAGLHTEETIVRCDVCADRETPACVSACPTKALSLLATRHSPLATDFTGHLVVVGSSAAGIAACEAARELAPDCRITMITADARWYSRPLLPYVLAGKVTSGKITPGVISRPADRDGLAWRAQEHLGDLGVEVIERARAVGLDAETKTLVVEGKKKISFDRLVIATGARATKLTVPGAELAGVFELRDVEDLEGIEKIVARAAVRAVVVGGGNVGLQTAEALVRREVQVTVVVRSPHLLSQMVDAEAGRRIGALFARHGVQVRTGRDVAEIMPFDLLAPARSEAAPGSSAGSRPAARRPAEPDPTASLRNHPVPPLLNVESKVARVRLDDGEWIDADLVVVGKGTQPNVEWLRSSGVRIGRGVVVDRNGRTSLDGVFAAGDCAEVEDPIAGQSVVSGIWPIAYEMGRAAGAAAVGAVRASAGALRMNSSKFFGTPVISIGEVRAGRVAGATEHVVAAEDEVYRKLVMKDGRVIGAVLYGDVSDAGLYYRLYRDGTSLDDTPAEDLERTRTRWIAALADAMSA